MFQLSGFDCRVYGLEYSLAGLRVRDGVFLWGLGLGYMSSSLN